jgi:hypothetical protein
LRVKAFAVFAMLASGSASATETVPPDPGATLAVAVHELAGQVESLRGQRFERAPVAVRTPEQMHDVAAEIRAFGAVDRERLAARARAWSDLGLGGEQSPSRLLGWLATDLSGVAFDPTGNRLLVAPDRLTEKDFTVTDGDTERTAMLMSTGVRVDEPMLCHALMHVRQLERAGADFLAGTTDRLLAQAAWAEGEANLLAVRYLFRPLGLADSILEGRPDVSQYLGGALVPTDLNERIGAEADLLRFVYLEGFAQLTERFLAGGWEAASLDPGEQRTTRELLHPGRQPAPAIFADPMPPLEDLKLADTDSLGEQGVVVVVSRLTGKDNLALQAGEGWCGDRLYRWESEDAAVTEWVTRWSTPEDFADFDYAVVRSLRVRFPATPLRDAENGVRVLTTKEVSIRLERKDRELRVLIASGTAAARLVEFEQPTEGAEKPVSRVE